MTTTEIEKSLREMAENTHASEWQRDALLAAADIVAKYSALGVGNQSYADIAQERDELRATVASLKDALKNELETPET